MSRKRPQARPEQVPIPAKPDEASKEGLENLESTPEVKSRHLCPTKHMEPLSLSILQSGPRSYVRCSVRHVAPGRAGPRHDGGGCSGLHRPGVIVLLLSRQTCVAVQEVDLRAQPALGWAWCRWAAQLCGTGEEPEMPHLEFDRAVVFFDLETTGISPSADRIVEVTAVKLHPDGTRETWTRRVNPGIPIPKSATDVHGITNEDVAGLPGFSFCARELLDFIGDADLGGFGVSRLDIPLLEAEFRRAGLEFSRRGRRIVDGQILFHMLEPRDLAAAHRKYCGCEMGNAHTSEADVEASIAVLEGILAANPDLPRTIRGLHALCNREQENWIDPQGKFLWSGGIPVLGFGKYKGVPLKTVKQNDPGYLEWITKSDFGPETKEIAEAALRGELPEPPEGD